MLTIFTCPACGSKEMKDGHCAYCNASVLKAFKTYEDLVFEKHPAPAGEGLQALEFFHNGYGISVVRLRLPEPIVSGCCEYFTYTSNDSEWEVAVVKGTKASWHLCYDTPITGDVIGHVTNVEVSKIMEEIQKLPKA